MQAKVFGGMTLSAVTCYLVLLHKITAIDAITKDVYVVQSVAYCTKIFICR